MLDVADYADDLRLSIEQSKIEMFSDGILIREILARESRVDQRHRGPCSLSCSVNVRPRSKGMRMPGGSPN